VGYSLTPNRREEHYRWSRPRRFRWRLLSYPLRLRKELGEAIADFRFEENVSWIGTIGARYHVGVDGISLWLVLLTTLFSADRGPLKLDFNC